VRFETGQALCGSFYREVLAPVIGAPHAAGLLGPGSDVLGYDTERSTDHDWGPHAVVLVAPGREPEVRARLDAALPVTFHGRPVSIGRDGLPSAPKVEVTALSSWARDRLGLDPVRDGLDPVDWLLVPQQRLLEVTAGAVFADETGELTLLRDRLAWYPDDVWWWLLACQWQRLAQEEPFVQRTAEVGDELGSRVLTARLVRDAMRLALLIARRYAPYGKWLGTAFARQEDAAAHRDGLGAQLAGALAAADPGSRQQRLGAGYQVLARRFNALVPQRPVDPSLRGFHDRPALVLGADRFAQAALARVRDPDLGSLPLIGAVDQVADSTDLLTRPALCRSLRPLYERRV
jgi:hypothetical protein